MKQTLAVVAVIACVIFFGWAIAQQTSSDHNTIKQWHSAQNQDVIEIDQPWFTSSPWWLHDDDDRIYRATVRDKQGQRRTCWHKFNIFGHDQKWP